MPKEDKSDIYRELYVQYCYLDNDAVIFEKIIEATNQAVGKRMLYIYKKRWLKDGLKAEVRKAKSEYKLNEVASKSSKRVSKKQTPKESPLSPTTIIKHGETQSELSEEEAKSYNHGYRPDVSGMKPTDIIRKICNEYVMGEYTLEKLLKVHGMGVMDFERMISTEPELALLYENSRMQQRKIVFAQFNDNLIQWLKKTTNGQAEVRITIEYEMRPNGNTGHYIEVPVKKYETKTIKPPGTQMLQQIMSVLKEAQTIDKTESQQFYQLAEGMTADQLLKEIAELQALKQTRLNERKQFNTSGN